MVQTPPHTTCTFRTVGLIVCRRDGANEEFKMKSLEQKGSQTQVLFLFELCLKEVRARLEAVCVKGHVLRLEEPTGSQTTASCFIYLLLADVLYMKDS